MITIGQVVDQDKDTMQYGPYRVMDWVELKTYPSSGFFVVNVHTMEVEQHCNTKGGAKHWAEKLDKQDQEILANKIDELFHEE